MSSDPSINNPTHLTPAQKKSRGKHHPTWRTIIWILLALLSLTSLEYYFIQQQSPASVRNNIAVLLFFNIILVLLFVLVVLITRNLIKLYNERKSRILGSKFQTKLIIAFLILTLVPSILLFTVASKLFTFSIGSWFNVKVEQTLRQSMDVAQEYYANIENRAFIHTQKLRDSSLKRSYFYKQSAGN